MIKPDQAKPEEDNSFGGLFWAFVGGAIFLAMFELGMVVYGIFFPVGNHSKRKLWIYTLYGIFHGYTHISALLQVSIYESCVLLAHRSLYITSLFTSAIFTIIEIFVLFGGRINSIGLKITLQLVFGGFAQAIVAKLTSMLASIGIIISVFASTENTIYYEFYCFYVLTLSSVNSLLFALLRSFDKFQIFLSDAEKASSKAIELITEIDAEFNSSIPKINILLNHLYMLPEFFWDPNTLTPHILFRIRQNINSLIFKRKRLIEKKKMAEIEILKCLNIANDLRKYDAQEHYSISIRVESEKKRAYFEKKLTFFVILVNDADNFLKIIEDIKNDGKYITQLILNSKVRDIITIFNALENEATNANKDFNQSRKVEKIELIKSQYKENVEEIEKMLKSLRYVANTLLFTVQSMSCIYTNMIYFFPKEDFKIL